jgi:hypothetical protein
LLRAIRPINAKEEIKMRNKPDLQQLLEQALQLAKEDSRFTYVACYLKPALETVQEITKANKSS